MCNPKPIRKLRRCCACVNSEHPTCLLLLDRPARGDSTCGVGRAWRQGKRGYPKSGLSRCCTGEVPGEEVLNQLHALGIGEQRPAVLAAFDYYESCIGSRLL